MKYMGLWGVLLCTLMPLMSLGFIYEAKVLRKWDTKQGKYIYFIGLSDFHDKAHKVTQTQLHKIEELLGQCNKDTTKIMLEDLSSRGNGQRIACGRFVINSRGGILGGLAQHCSRKNFDVDNVEYRYCRVSSLGPVLNNLQANVDAFPSVKEISVSAVVQEINDVMREIETYQDGAPLNGYYQKGICEVKAELAKLKMMHQAEASIADYLIAHSTRTSRLDLLKRLLTFDSGLLDLKLVHQVVNTDREKIIAIAGGSHISRVTEMLEKIGYETIYRTKPAYAREHNLNQCLGSTIVDDSYCMRPDPIELEPLDQFVR